MICVYDLGNPGIGHELPGDLHEAFADLCGLHRTYMGGIERGERNVSLVSLERIAGASRSVSLNYCAGCNRTVFN